MEFSFTAFGAADVLFWRFSGDAEIRISTERHLLGMALQGMFSFEEGGKQIVLAGNAGAIIPPTPQRRLCWIGSTIFAAVSIREQEFAQCVLQMLSITPAAGLGGFQKFDFNAQPGIDFSELAEVFLLGSDDVAPIRLLFAKLILHSLLQKLDGPGAQKNIDHTQSAAPRHVRQAEDYIKSHLSERLGGIMLAGIVKVSPRSLHRGFVNFRGITPARYIQDVRLEAARGLLTNVEGPFDIREIALRAGFKSYPAFWRSFVKKFGVAPSRLRSPRKGT